MIKDSIKLTISSLRRRQLRAWLTIIGIIIGIASIVALISVSQGMQTALEEEFSKFGATTIRVTPKGLRGPPTKADILTTKDVETIENIPGIEYISPIFMQNANVEFKKEEIFQLVAGYPADNIKKGFYDLNFNLKEGQIFTKSDTNSMIIGEGIKDLFENDIQLRSSIIVNDKKFKIKGIIEESGNPATDQSIYIPLETARTLFGDPDGVSVITIKILDGIDVNEIAKKVQRKLKRARDNENFEVFTPQQAINQINEILGIVQFILVGIASISLLVGGIGIMNAMYTSVLERTRQIGLMKAVGARNSSILMIFLVESGVIGLVGGIAGVIAGLSIAKAVELIAAQLGYTLLKITINPYLIGFGLLFAFIVGVVSGLLPAYQASKLVPVKALRYE